MFKILNPYSITNCPIIPINRLISSLLKIIEKKRNKN